MKIGNLCCNQKRPRCASESVHIGRTRMYTPLMCRGQRRSNGLYSNSHIFMFSYISCLRLIIAGACPAIIKRNGCFMEVNDANKNNCARVLLGFAFVCHKVSILWTN